jgi:hypothetical protein
VRRALSLWLVAALTACSSAPTLPPAAREGPQELGERGPVAAPQRSPLVEPPGALLADVNQANIQTTICASGWTAMVRPSTSFTQHLKQLMLARAGLKPADSITYELDHFVPLALGGSTWSEDNLWLQSWVGEWSAPIKDRLERRLQVMVCAGRLTLRSARAAIQRDWKAAYLKYVAADRQRGMDEDMEEEPVE